MADTLGRITVPDLQDSGQVFPIVPDWGYGYAQAPHVVVHQFGSGNAKDRKFLSDKRETSHGSPPVDGTGARGIAGFT